MTEPPQRNSESAPYGINLITGVLTTTGLPWESTPLNRVCAVWVHLLPLHQRAFSTVEPLAGMSIEIPWMMFTENPSKKSVLEVNVTALPADSVKTWS